MLTAVAVVGIGMFKGHSQSSGSWTFKESSLKTRWTDKVSSVMPLQDYPRPQMVRQNNFVLLNGIWKYAVTPLQDSLPAIYSGEILVPFPLESSLSGAMKSLQPNQLLWYKTNFQYKDKKGRTLLHFGAVDYKAWIYINGVEAGSHEGGYTAFTVDISPFVKSGNNEIVVKVFDPTEAGIGPHGKQVLNPASIYYTATSGIWQTVWMEHVADIYIKAIKLIPDIDHQILQASVEVSEPCQLEITAFDKQEKVSTANGSSDGVLKLTIPMPKLWSPESPFLYDLTIKAKKNKQTFDVVKSYFGMRKVSVAKDSLGTDRIFLNNKPYFNLGVLDQGFWPDGLYTAPTDEALLFDIEVIKAMGFNTIRKHIKVEPARWYYYADRVGMLVWQDFVNPNQQLPPGSKEIFEKQVRETQDQLFNYPSIVSWIIFNEKWGAYDQARITRMVKDYDPSRIVNGHSGEYLYVNNELRSPSPNAYVNADVTDVHSYPNPMMSLKLPGKAQVLGEFGGIGVFIPGHQWNKNAGWGYIQKSIPSLKGDYGLLMREIALLRDSGLSGSIYTQPFDVEGEQNGLMTYDREIVKMPIDSIFKYNSLLTSGHSSLNEFTRRFAVQDIDREYSDLLSEYAGGKKDKPLLEMLTLLALQYGDTIKSQFYGSQYIDEMKSGTTAEDLHFLRQTCKRIGDVSFNYIIANADRISGIQDLENETINTARTVIQQELTSKIFDPHLNIQFQELEQQIRKKYGWVGELVIWRDLALYNLRAKNIPLFVQYKEKIHQKYPAAIGEFDMNNDAWFVFENTKDSGLLKTAMSWSRRVLRNQPDNVEAMDTYANLLYKIGNTTEAIVWEDKAVQLAPNHKEIRANYDKMKRGEPTWQ